MKIAIMAVFGLVMTSQLVSGQEIGTESNGLEVLRAADSYIDVACAPEYSELADGVCRILDAEGHPRGTGALIMCADMSFKPYILTAFHCIDKIRDGTIDAEERLDAQNWTFQFNYQVTTCNGSSVSTVYSYKGAKILAENKDYDFALLEMEKPPGREAVWLGWDRSGDTPASCVNIHHPGGAVKKVSFGGAPTLNSASVGDYHIPVGAMWFLPITEGLINEGSSGSPLFDQNGRITGYLSGSQNPPLRGQYGRLYSAWNAAGPYDEQLRIWLDPKGTGVTTVNSMRRNWSVMGPDAICNDALVTYTLTPDVPEGLPINWTIKGNGALIYSGQGTPTIQIGSSSSFEQSDIILTATIGTYTTPDFEIHVGASAVTSIVGNSYVRIPMANSSVIEHYSALASVEPGEADFAWSITPSTARIVFTYESSAQVEFSKNGTYQLSCRLINTTSGCGDQLIPYTETILVTGGSWMRLSYANRVATVSLSESSAEQETKTLNYEIRSLSTGILIKKGVLRGVSKSADIDLDELQPGLYLLNVSSPDGYSETLKFTL